MRKVIQLLLGFNEFAYGERVLGPRPAMEVLTFIIVVPGPPVPDSRPLKAKTPRFISECPLVPT